MDTAEAPAARADDARVYQWVLIATAAVAAAVVLCAILVAAELPFGEWDAMAYGSWARQIADGWPRIQFAQTGAIELHRPLFYFLEGTVWAVFGFHQALGRLLALAFGMLLALALAYTAARSAPKRYALVSAASALCLLFAAQPYERYVISGLSDVPVAAMLAVTAALLAASRGHPRLLGAVGLAACLSLLTKPTALASLLGLTGAVIVGRRATLRARIPGGVALLLGAAVALIYDEIEARRLHVGLKTFLTSGSDGFYSSLAANRRGHVLLDDSWLGGDLRLLLLFAAVYALVRLIANHRNAVMIALPAALAWEIAGPHLAGGASGLVSGSGGSLQSLAVLVLAGALLFALVAPSDAIPSRTELARLLVWAAPPIVVWVTYSAYDVRLLSAAWPPLLLLAAAALRPVFPGAASVDGSAVAVPAAALLVLAALGTVQLNGLGHDGWHRFTSGFGDAAAMRSLALGGDFSDELAALQPQLASVSSVLTTDSRLQFFYGDKVRLAPPESCAQLQGAPTALVLLESDEERAIYGAKAQASFWERCANPSPTLVAERPGAYALFTTGRTTNVAGSCGPEPTSGLVVEFGRFGNDRAASAFLDQAKGLGFVQAKVERVSCTTYRVVETGIPSRSVGRSIVAEAKSAHLDARLVDTPQP